MIISIEGNIGAGKSTVIDYLKTLKLPNVVFIDEPVSEWMSVTDMNGMNALDCFYANKKDNAFGFQILAYTTRLKMLMDAHKNNDMNTIIVMDRSLDTDKNIFARMMYDDGLFSSMQWASYNYIFDKFSTDVPMVETILYINTSPAECFERIHKRNRVAEQGITLDYLQKCDKYHEDWLGSSHLNIECINGHDCVETIQNDVQNILNKIKNI
jgi:deoxyguanosine kinase